MARKPDVPCASCGQLLFGGGRGSLPPGERTCRPCRFIAPPRLKSETCTVCSSTYQRKPGTSPRTCSPACAKARMVANLGKPRACRDCSAPVTSHMPTPRCRPCDRERNRRKCQRRRDAGRGRAKHGGMTVFDLGDRDGWKCHLCRTRVDRALPWPHPKSPTFDHLIPVSDGGTDDATNLALAHAGCNSSRGAGGVVQLLLVG